MRHVYAPPRLRWLLPALLTCAGVATAGDRLTATTSVGTVEGRGGGGLVPWALIGSYGSRNQIDTAAHLSRVRTAGGCTLTTVAAALGVHGTWDAAVAQMRFGLGNAVYTRDCWWPQLSVGATKVWLDGLGGHNTLADLTLRRNPDTLGVLREERAHDVFVGWWPVHQLSLTATVVNLGNVANKANQRGWYVSVQPQY